MADELAIVDQPITIKALSNMLGGTTLPDRYETIGDAIATILVGREFGMAPIAALNELFVVNGQVGMSGKAMAALVAKAGHRIDMTLDPEVGTAVAWRRDPVTLELNEVGTFTFTMEDAETANLTGKGTYKKFPADMLGWKAVSRAVKFAFPDVIVGYLPEEQRNVTFEEPLAIEEVAAALDGEILDVDPETGEILDD